MTRAAIENLRENQRQLDMDGCEVAVSQVADTRDGHPSGRHMIQAYRMMAIAVRSSDDEQQREIGEVYDCAARCIENEALRADRAEALLAAIGERGAAEMRGDAS